MKEYAQALKELIESAYRRAKRQKAEPARIVAIGGLATLRTMVDYLEVDQKLSVDEAGSATSLINQKLIQLKK